MDPWTACVCGAVRATPSAAAVLAHLRELTACTPLACAEPDVLAAPPAASAWGACVLLVPLVLALLAPPRLRARMARQKN